MPKQTPVSFADALGKYVRKSSCPFMAAISPLPAEEQRLVLEAMQADPKMIPVPAIKSALLELGVTVSRHALYAHRNGQCDCVVR